MRSASCPAMTTYWSSRVWLGSRSSKRQPSTPSIPSCLSELLPGGVARGDPGITAAFRSLRIRSRPVGIMPFTRRSGKNRTAVGGLRKRHYGKAPSQGLGAGLPGRALGCEVRGGRSEEHPAASGARAGGGRWNPRASVFTFETVIQEQTESLYLISPSGDVFTNPLFLFATCFAVKPSPVAHELPIDGGRSAEMWISPDPARQFHSPYSYGSNPVNGIDPDGKWLGWLNQGDRGGHSE